MACRGLCLFLWIFRDKNRSGAADTTPVSSNNLTQGLFLYWPYKRGQFGISGSRLFFLMVTTICCIITLGTEVNP